MGVGVGATGRGRGRGRGRPMSGSAEEPTKLLLIFQASLRDHSSYRALIFKWYMTCFVVKDAHPKKHMAP